LTVFVLLTRGATAPVGTAVERNRISSAAYRSKYPEKAKLSARLSHFRARVRKQNITDPGEIERRVQELEAAWQAKHA
jgi:hypothetical protein